MCLNFCSTFGYAFGSLLYVLQKIASLCAVTALMTVIIVTLMVTLSVGVGIGYHYAIVNNKSSKTELGALRRSLREVQKMEGSSSSDARNTSSSSMEASDLDPVRLTVTSAATQKFFTEPLLVKRTVIIPLHLSDDVSVLIEKIKALNRNVTLELLAN